MGQIPHFAHDAPIWIHDIFKTTAIVETGRNRIVQISTEVFNDDIIEEAKNHCESTQGLPNALAYIIPYDTSPFTKTIDNMPTIREQMRQIELCAVLHSVYEQRWG